MLSILVRNGTETPEPVRAEVAGIIPDWLQGTLVRNGPGMFSVGQTSYDHWFDGLALIHSYTFKDGEVFYRSKYLKSNTYKKNTGANRIVVTEFGTMVYPDPCKNIFSRTFSHFSNIIADFTDNNLVNIIRYGEDYYASSEVNFINQIDPFTLDTVGRMNYRNHIVLNLATSHPHYDEEGNTYNMGTAIIGIGKPKYIIFKVPFNASDPKSKKPALSKVQKICSIPFRSSLLPSYFHSFGMSENYFIFVEQAFKLDVVLLATAYFRGISWGRCLKFDEKDVSWFHLINRKTGKTMSTKFYADPFVMFHHINAYEDNDHVIFDIITYKDSNLYDLFYMENMRQEVAKFIEKTKDFSPPTCQRFVLPITVDKNVPAGSNLVTLENTTATAVKQEDGSIYCSPDTLLQGLELPRINDKYNGKKYRYFYGSMMEWSPHPNKIGKMDIATRTHVQWKDEDCYPSEPIFVPSPEAVDEDDGVLLSSVISLNPDKPHFLLVLNAKTLEEIGRASVDVPVHMDLHGLFIPATQS
ncbi:beta,beta-carotene 15,15'-dioxygenase isoform X1 [Denticeps clupeoides]|uniref:Uncharacterized protein n=1 Tax=Denticeps clupeoides TaxID=299321 RepID=A0AAY4BIL5_9TELE|nr:beta,beta-carotene 15,15'-dioxygenase-like isoform X1 [Denticeps clupeoides]